MKFLVGRPFGAPSCGLFETPLGASRLHSSLEFLVSKRAWKQIEKIHQWRVENRPESPDLFLDELARAEELLVASPEMGTLYTEHKTGKVRRILLTSTQHYLYYRYRPDRDELLVVVVRGTPKQRQPKL